MIRNLNYMWSSSRVNFGTTTFLLNVNDLLYVTMLLFALLYADDSSLFLTCTDIQLMIEAMSD